MRLVCSQCRVEVAKPLSFADEGPPHVDDDDVGIKFPREGFFVIGDPLGWTPEIHAGASNFYAVNFNDLVNTKFYPGSGCCGSDGMSGITIYCVNGHRIGYEFADCWQRFHFVHIPPSLVRRTEEG